MKTILTMSIKMWNNLIRTRQLHLIIVIALILGSLGCTEKQKKTILLFSPRESVINDKRFILDSIVIIKTKTTILIRQYRGRGEYLDIKFIKNNNCFSELRESFRGNIEEGKSIDKSIQIDTLPIFSIVDTTFTYKSKRDFYPTTIDLSLGDAQYKVEKQGNTYLSTRQSMIDSLYSECYYYENFNITKYVAKYRGNTCVYR